MNFVRQTDSEAFKAHYDEMMDYLSSPEKITAFRQQLASASSRHRQLTSQACRQALDHIASCGYDQGKAVVAAKVLTRLSDGALNGYDTSKKQGKTIVGVLDDPMSAFNKKLRTMMEADPDEALLSNIITAATYLDEGWRFRPLWAALTKQIYILGLLEGIYHYIEAFRAENNTFLLSDTNSILKEIIGDGDTPFVLSALACGSITFSLMSFRTLPVCNGKSCARL